jgi:lipoate-protein ligase A
MRIVRGRAETIARDRAISARLLDWAAAGRPAVRAWSPHRQVAFGRRDARDDGYDRARTAARERGFPPVERDVGGRAVAYSGSTVAFARAEPASRRGSIDDRYDRATGAVRAALETVGVVATDGEPPDSFCPGTHSLQSNGKVVGFAQRVRKDAAITAGICVVRDHGAIAGVLEPVYDALGVAFDPESVGSVARAGGEADPERVARALEAALVGDHDPELVSAGSIDVDA